MNKPICPLCSEGELTEIFHYKPTPTGKTLTWVSSECNICGVEQTSSEQMDFNKLLSTEHRRNFTYEQL